MKKKNKKAVTAMTPQSPYSSTIIDLDFEKEGTLRLPQEVLMKCPALYSRYKDQIRPPFGYGVQVHDMTYNVGHALVHFLFTGSYSILEHQDSPGGDKTAAELATTLDIYTAAKSYKMHRLEDLARREVQRLTNSLQLPVVLRTVQDHFFAKSDSADQWMSELLGDQVRSAFKSMESIRSLLKELDDGQCISTIVLKSLAQVCSMQFDGADDEPAISRDSESVTESGVELVDYVNVSEGLC